MDNDFLVKWGNNENFFAYQEKVSSFIWQKFSRLSGKLFLALLKTIENSPLAETISFI